MSPILAPTEPADGEPYIDWTARELVAVGRGRAPKTVVLLAEALPLAEEAATLGAAAALRRLLSTANLLPPRVATALARQRSPQAKTLRSRWWSRRGPEAAEADGLNAGEQAVLSAVERGLSHARAREISYLASGAVELSLTLPLDGGATGLGDAFARLALLGRADPSPLTPRRPMTPEPADLASRPATGVVIHTRDLPFVPSLWPEVWAAASDGHPQRLLYGKERLEMPVIRAFGVGPFVRSIEQALRHPRVADRAMLVRAAAAVPGRPSAVVIAAEDADAIEAVPALVAEGRFVFLLGAS